MKTFTEWLKDKNLEENIADYVPGFIRRPLQAHGVLGRTTEEEKARQARKAEEQRAKALRAEKAGAPAKLKQANQESEARRQAALQSQKDAKDAASRAKYEADAAHRAKFPHMWKQTSNGTWIRKTDVKKDRQVPGMQ